MSWPNSYGLRSCKYAGLRALLAGLDNLSFASLEPGPSIPPACRLEKLGKRKVKLEIGEKPRAANKMRKGLYGTCWFSRQCIIP